MIDINRDEIFQNSRYTLFDHRRSEEILEEMKIEPVDEKLNRYKSNSLRHVKRINKNRMPKIMVNYKPDGHRRLGRLLKRLLDGAATGISVLNRDG
jgi:hypothetical protein